MKTKFKRFFFLGLAALLPTMLTLFVVVWCYGKVNETLGRKFTLWLIGTPDGGVAGHARWIRSFLPAWFPDAAVGNILGLLLVLGIALVVGRFVASFLGRRLWEWVESQIHRVPLVKQVYGFFKQVIDFFTNEKRVFGKAVVAVPYPREGVYTLGLITNDGIEDMRRNGKEDYIVVFLPTSPTPFTGFTCMVKRSDVIPLSMTVDEAVQYVVSLGVIIPADQVVQRRAPPAPAGEGRV